MKPRVLVITSTFPRNEYDHEPRFVADLCSELAHRFEITVLTQHRPGCALRETTADYEIIRFRYAPENLELLSENGGITSSLKKNRWLWLLIPFFIFFQVVAIRKLVKSGKFSIIHAHWLIPQGFAAAIATLMCSNPPPVICTGHGADIFGFQGGISSKIKRWIVNRSSSITVVSQSMKSYLKNELSTIQEKIYVIPMGTNLNQIFTPGDGIRNRGQIAFVGRLVEKKGLKYLIQIIPSLSSQLENIRLVIAGTGPEKPELEHLVADLNIEACVAFVGAKNHSEIAELYRSSEACVFPFVQASGGDMEGFGLVTVEAMGCKCPVVVGDIPAIKDIVINGETGLICRPKDPEDMVNIILKLMKNEDIRTKLANTAYDFAHQNFSWEKIGERYAKLFSDTINTTGKISERS